MVTAGKRQVTQAITLWYFNHVRIRATPEIVYHAARSALPVADQASPETVATYLWAIREGYGTAHPAQTAEALFPGGH